MPNVAWRVILGILAWAILQLGAGTDRALAAGTTLQFAQSGDVVQMDPVVRNTTSSAHIMLNVYDGLVNLDRNLKLVPGLATSWKQATPTEWIFQLRKGVKFHNGEPFNADVVTYFYDRLRKYDEDKRYDSSIRLIPAVTSVEKVDDFTVRFTTKVPDPVLPARLASYFLLIPPRRYVEQSKNPQILFDQPVGTGPYRFVEWVKDDHLTLEANDEYWGGAPKIKRIISRPIPEPSSRLAALQTGAVDLALDVPIISVKDVRRNPNLEVRAVEEATRTFWLYLNTRIGGPLANVKVRQALNYAVDKKTIIAKLLDGFARPTASIVTNQSFGYCEVEPYTYSPAKAKELLKQAGFEGGFTVDLGFPPGHYLAQDEVVQAIGNYLGQVGVKVRFVPEEWANFLARIRTRDHKGMFYVGKTNMGLDADYIFQEFHPRALFGWYGPLQGKALELYEQERQEMQPERRKSLACEIQKLVRDDAPVLFLWQQQLLFAAHKNLVWEPRGDGFIYGIEASFK